MHSLLYVAALVGAGALGCASEVGSTDAAADVRGDDAPPDIAPPEATADAITIEDTARPDASPDIAPGFDTAPDVSPETPDPAPDAPPDVPPLDGAFDDARDVSLDLRDAPPSDALAPDAPPPDAPAHDAGPDAPPPDVDPPPPTFPERIGHLSFAIRTGAGTNDGTDGNTLSLCLTATRCFPMNVADVDDFRRGEIDVYHFDDVALDRRAVDRVEIRSVDGADAWRPTCVEMQWDGEPVHCADGLSTLFGNGGPSEVRSWRDPAGVHRGCVTCYPEAVTHGPVVGAAGAGAARVLVRSDATRRVALRVTDPARPSTPERRLVAYPSPLDDFTRQLVVDGLEPAHEYAAAVEVDGRPTTRSARFRTAPADGAPGAYRVAFGSCARDLAQPIFRVVEAQRPDLFLFVGDNHYANSGDLGSLWWNYRTALEVPERASLLASTPGLATWDDHDYVGNNTDRTSPGRAAALRAFADYQPNPTFGDPAEPGVYTRSRWGDLDFFMLDVRYERDPPGTAGARIWGDRQAAWLEGELQRSTATFKFIASGTLFSPTPDETWLDYPTSRTRLFEFIRVHRIGGVVLLSGDVHRSMLRRIHRAGVGAYELPEVVSSPLANSTSACPASAEPDAAQIACYTGGPSFVVLEVDTRAADPRVVARVLDAAGAERGRMEVLRSTLR